MTEAQKKFVELEKKKDEYKKFSADLSAALEELQKEIGVSGHFQDEDGTVYQLEIPEGKFVYFDKIGYKRTKRGDEKRGDLSMVKAEELGYKLNAKN